MHHFLEEREREREKVNGRKKEIRRRRKEKNSDTTAIMPGKASDEYSSEPLIEKEESNGPGHRRPLSSPKLVKGLLVSQIVTLCLLPFLFILGYREGSKELPKLPTHREYIQSSPALLR